jgi:hypothetical protein
MLSTMPQTLSNIFALVLHSCKRLISINFCQLNCRKTMCTFDLSTNCMSSTLTILKINVETFNDCLYLLDGRLDSLSKLIIYVEIISYKSGTLNNMVSVIINCCVV